MDVAVGDLDRRLAVVGLGAGEHLEQQDAGGVDVGARVGDAALDLLGGQVGDGAHQHTGGRGVAGGAGHGPGEAEVGDLDAPVVGEQDVLGLDVAVDDAGVVGGAERGEHRLHDLQASGGR